MKILITSGATREPIDDVRFITNVSSGETGRLIADAFHGAGFEVTLLAGEGAKLPNNLKNILCFKTFEDLDRLLRAQLEQESFGVVIHLAAVSDYSVDFVQVGSQKRKAPIVQKLDSSQDITLGLRRNFKIVERIKTYSKEPLTLFAFKLTSTLDLSVRAAQVEKLFQKGDVDYVVHNDLSDFKNEGRHVFEIFHKGQRIVSGSSKQELSESLIEVVRSHL